MKLQYSYNPEVFTKTGYKGYIYTEFTQKNPQFTQLGRELVAARKHLSPREGFLRYERKLMWDAIKFNPFYEM